MIKKTLYIFGLFVSFLLISIVSINIYVFLVANKSIFDINDCPISEIGIIPGAKVHQYGILSDVLRDRALTAIELYKSNKIKKILVSGDNKTEFYNEVDPIANYLIKNRVSKKDMIIDNAGLDTYDTMYRAKNIFHINEAIIITQEFHLNRAVFLCKKVGIKCNGVIADRQTYIKAEFFKVREFFANVKAFLNVLFNSDPEYL